MGRTQESEKATVPKIPSRIFLCNTIPAIILCVCVWGGGGGGGGGNAPLSKKWGAMAPVPTPM